MSGIEKLTTPAQIAAAQEFAKEWQPTQQMRCVRSSLS